MWNVFQALMRAALMIFHPTMRLHEARSSDGREADVRCFAIRNLRCRLIGHSRAEYGTDPALRSIFGQAKVRIVLKKNFLMPVLSRQNAPLW